MSEFHAVPHVIDSHVHLYPEEINRAPAAWAESNGEQPWARMCARRRKDGRPVQGFPSVDQLLRTMDRAGVERAVLLGWYWLRAENCTLQNRFFSDLVRRHPDRLSAFATVQPAEGADQAVAELCRAREEGLCGIGELSPHAQAYAMDGAEFAAVLSCAAQFNWPVNLHVTDARGPIYPGRIETPREEFILLARAWPNVTFVLAHWGGGEPLSDANTAEFERVFYDTAASPLLYDAKVWRRFINKVGADRVWFGSDFPLNNYPASEAEPEMARLLAEVQAAGLSVAEKEAIFCVNAARGIGVNVQDGRGELSSPKAQ